MPVAYADGGQFYDTAPDAGAIALSISQVQYMRAALANVDTAVVAGGTSVAAGGTIATVNHASYTGLVKVTVWAGINLGDGSRVTPVIAHTFGHSTTVLAALPPATGDGAFGCYASMCIVVPSGTNSLETYTFETSIGDAGVTIGNEGVTIAGAIIVEDVLV